VNVAARTSTPYTLILRKAPTKFSMWGGALPNDLTVVDGTISPGLVARLHRYALTRMLASGFDVTDWKCEISTLDGDERPSDRSYTVEFTNAQGGSIALEGIETKSGHPFLHHGFTADGRG
jgi:hypothetical protein